MPNLPTEAQLHKYYNSMHAELMTIATADPSRSTIKSTMRNNLAHIQTQRKLISDMQKALESKGLKNSALTLMSGEWPDGFNNYKLDDIKYYLQDLYVRCQAIEAARIKMKSLAKQLETTSPIRLEPITRREQVKFFDAFATGVYEFFKLCPDLNPKIDRTGLSFTTPTIFCGQHRIDLGKYTVKFCFNKYLARLGAPAKWNNMSQEGSVMYFLEFQSHAQIPAGRTDRASYIAYHQPNHSVGAIHPHIKGTGSPRPRACGRSAEDMLWVSNYACLGELRWPLVNCLNERFMDFSSAAEFIMTYLRTYNSESPYMDISHFVYPFQNSKNLNNYVPINPFFLDHDSLRTPETLDEGYVGLHVFEQMEPVPNIPFIPEPAPIIAPLHELDPLQSVPFARPIHSTVTPSIRGTA